MFLLTTQEWLPLIIIVGCTVIPIVILAFVAFIIALKKRAKMLSGVKKSEKVNIENSEDMELIFQSFGEENILKVECEMSRVTVEVKEIELVNTESLQDKGASGILLVGNKVKCNFKENSENIANYLKGKINND